MNKEKTKTSLALIILTALLLLAIVLSSLSISSAEIPVNEYRYGPIAGDSLVQASDGGYVFVARAAASVLENGSYAGEQNEVIKTYRDGNVEWNTTTGYSPNGDQWIMATLDGGYAVAGSSYNPSSIGWLIKVDAEGNKQWNQTYQQGGSDTFINHAIQTRDRGFALIGSMVNGKTWVIKTGSTGNIEWNKTYENLSSRLIIETDDGYVFAGDNGTQPWLLTSHLVKTDKTGNIQWQKTYENQLGYRPRILIATKEGGFMLAGARYLNSSSASAFALKTYSNGNLEWNMTYGENSGFRAVVESREGGYVFAGGLYTSEPHYSARLVKTNSLGRVGWEKSFDGRGNGYVYSLVQTEDGGYAFAGATGEAESSATEIWLVKIASPSGEETPTNWLIIIVVIALVGVGIAIGVLLISRRRKNK